MSDSLATHGLEPSRLLCPWDFPGKSTGVVCQFLLQGIFLTQGSNPGLPHWQAGSLPPTLPGKPKSAIHIPQFSPSVMSDSLRPCGLQHTRLPCPSPTPGAYSDSRPWSQWCHTTTISSSVIPFSSCLQSFPASGSFHFFFFFLSTNFYFVLENILFITKMLTYNRFIIFKWIYKYF